MKKRIQIISQLLLSIVLVSGAFAQVPENETGMKLFNDWAPDKTGTSDVTGKLQEAVDYCIKNAKTLYISSGTYLVSDQILGIVFEGMDCGTHDGSFACTISGDAINRPVVKLKDNSSGFQDANNPKAVLQIQTQGMQWGEACQFWCIVKNLDFDLGNNPGAAGLNNASAQDSHLSNIKVYGNEFYAGFTGVPGRNATTTNCEVDGGKYGFYINNSTGASLFGLTCRNQSVAAIYLSVWYGTSVTGLEVTGCKGTAVICRGTESWQGNFILTDASIEMDVNNTNYAFDAGNRALVLRNVYVSGSNNLVKGNGFTWNENVENWIRINTFASTPQSINSVVAYNFINGAKSNNLIKEYEAVSGAPLDIAARNTPDEIYAFNSPGAVSVVEYGAVANDGKDDYQAFHTAINSSDVVFIPAGRYHLSAPLELNNNTVILGEPGKRSWLTPTFHPSHRTWVISTPDTKGYVAIQDMVFDTPDEDYIGSINWRTSSGFILNVRNYMAAVWSEKNKHSYEFTGSAGGKFFGITDHHQIWQGKPGDDNFRKIYIDGTYNPITFYGLNLERGGKAGKVWQNPFVEAVNSSNIRVYGTKSETEGKIFSFTWCDNVSVNAVIARAYNPYQDPVIIEFGNGTTNAEAGIVYCYNSSGETMIKDGQYDQVKRTDFVGLYRMGNFKLSAFATDNITAAPMMRTGEINIYPNPTQGVIKIHPANENIVRLTDGQGRMMKTWSNTNEINISSYKSGMYFLQVTDNSGNVTTSKIIKQNM